MTVTPTDTEKTYERKVQDVLERFAPLSDDARHRLMAVYDAIEVKAPPDDS